MRCNSCIAAVGPISEFYCDYHAGYHAGESAARMAAKRAADPVYREFERFAVKQRMRQIRAKRKAAGITGKGRLYKSKPRPASPATGTSPA